MLEVLVFNNKMFSKKKKNNKKNKKPKNYKICIKCGKPVENGQHFVHVEEWKKQDLLKENWMHKKCWDDKMGVKKKALRGLKLATGMLRKIKGEPDKKVVIE